MLDFTLNQVKGRENRTCSLHCQPSHSCLAAVWNTSKMNLDKTSL